MTATPKIELKAVRKQFGSKVVLESIDLSVGEGESLVVIGGSGSGKSVMLKCILGLLHPERGEIRIDGEDVTRLGGRAREAINSDIGMLFQGAALFDSLKVWENVGFGLIQGRGVDREEAKAIAHDKLAAVGLNEDVGELYPAELSGGMKKRVALARAIAAEPGVIFFDEPTTGLDPIMGDVINGLILDCVKDLGATTLTITHDMASARKIADKMAMIYHGNIIWSGPAKGVDDCGEPHVEQFINGRADGPIKMEVKAL